MSPIPSDSSILPDRRITTVFALSRTLRPMSSLSASPLSLLLPSRNIATAMTGVPEFIVERQLALFDQVDPAYGAGVREALTHAKTENAGVDTSHATE